MRVLVTGWPSFTHGEATAGDVLSMRRVHSALDRAGIAGDLAWSAGYLPGERTLDDAPPARYSHLVFVCGPAHGEQVSALHRRHPDCLRIAVGVSVVDTDDPAVTGFHRVFARDGAGTPRPDLSSAAPVRRTPVVGVVLAPGQAEYGARRRHEPVHERLTEWLTGLDCARLPLDTRLDTRDWRHCATPDQFSSILNRLDMLVSTRLHGLVLGLRSGIPVLAVDPVAGGGKVTAQAFALGWSALVSAGEAVAPDGGALNRWWSWCRSPRGRRAAAEQAAAAPDESLLGPLMAELSR